MLPQHDRVVLVVLQDGRQLEGELHVLSGRYELGGVVFDPREVEKLEELTSCHEKSNAGSGTSRTACTGSPSASAERTASGSGSSTPRNHVSCHSHAAPHVGQQSSVESPEYASCSIGEAS